MVDTLEEARGLIEKVKSGDIDEQECPCCGQFCKLYRRRFYSAMARFLILLVQKWEKNGGGWVDVRKDISFKDCTRSGNHGFLTFWGLAIRKPNDEDPSIRTSGLWMPTPRGIAFVYKRLSVPSHVYVFNYEVQAWEDRKIYIDEALGKKYHYRDMMEGGW
jgi:hypothetical protein